MPYTNNKAKSKEKEQKRGIMKARNKIALIAVLIGITILLFPTIINEATSIEMRNKVEEIEEQVNEVKQENGEMLNLIYQLMKQYNKKLLENGQVVPDGFTYSVESFNLIQFGFKENVIGSIKIPKLGVELPIYLGATKANMYKGAVHLSQTSYPLGEKDSNVVIAAHRGLIRNQMFRHIDKLSAGDEVIMTTLWQQMTYKVFDTQIIEPSDSKKLNIQPGRDLLTLVTCHPYRVNSHRLVVFCERAE